jgi:hypothetical protein
MVFAQNLAGGQNLICKKQTPPFASFLLHYPRGALPYITNTQCSKTLLRGIREIFWKFLTLF